MRTFVAIDIDEPIRRRLTDFLEAVQGWAPDARWVRPESLHLTLKFIGEIDPGRLEECCQALAGLEASPFDLAFRSYGFFPGERSARVFWIGVEGGEQVGALAGALDHALAPLGIAPEKRAYSPHLTLARAEAPRRHARGPRTYRGKETPAPGRQPGSPLDRHSHERSGARWELLRQKLQKMPAPDFGTMTARAFFLYESKLSPLGARYSKLRGFPLRGQHSF